MHTKMVAVGNVTALIASHVVASMMSVQPSPKAALRALADRCGFDITVHKEDEEDRRLNRIRVTAVRRAPLFTFTVTLGGDDAPPR